MAVKLDLVVSTYNRAKLLERTLASIRAARRPEGLQPRVILVDNNSAPEEARRNRALAAEYQDLGLRLMHESEQGLSHARNAGIAVSDADWIAFIDDDEELEPQWFEVAARTIGRADLGFFGGPYLPNWEAPPPAWLPASRGRYIAVIGWIELADRPKLFGVELDAIAMGGNVVIRKDWLDRVGPYATSLGRVRGRLVSGEDQDMHERLVAAGARGLYVPELAIRHFIPVSRLTKDYHRRWAFWNGFSTQIMETARPKSGPRLLGIPRYQVGNALRRLPMAALDPVAPRAASADSFTAQLDVLGVLGRLYARLSGATRLAPR